MLAASAGCTAKTPKGEVLATVNGEEITAQDLVSEARATNMGGRPSAQMLLQSVVARVLLAQDAHTLKLDTYRGYPADLARLKQDFLAQKTLQSVIKPPPKPTPAQIDSFIAAHPFIFKDRMVIQADEVRFQPADGMQSLDGLDSLDQIVERLKSLNVQYDRQTAKLDSAKLPPPLTEKLASLPIGKLVIIRGRDVMLALVEQGRQPISETPEQQTAGAVQLIGEIATQQQVGAVLNRLRATAKITYQKGYAPPAPPKPGAAPAPTQPAAH